MNRLSEREKQILVCLIKGMTRKEVADSLGISPHTVAQHQLNIKDKVGAKTIAHAAAKYVSEFGMPA